MSIKEENGLHNGRRCAAFSLGLCSSLLESYDCWQFLIWHLMGRQEYVITLLWMSHTYKHAKLIPGSDLMHNSERNMIKIWNNNNNNNKKQIEMRRKRVNARCKNHDEDNSAKYSVLLSFTGTLVDSPTAVTKTRFSQREMILPFAWIKEKCYRVLCLLIEKMQPGLVTNVLYSEILIKCLFRC